MSPESGVGAAAAKRTAGVPVPAYFSLDRVAADARALVAAVEPGASEDADLRGAYQRAVSRAQGQPFALPVEGEPSLHFEVAEPEVDRALRYLLAEEDGEPHRRLGPATEALTRERFRAAWELLRARAPELLSPVEILVGRYVFADCPPREGQTSLRNALGTVFWISPFANWRAPNYADAIVHEATHQALFLTDMVHRCFTVGREGLDDPSAQALSSVRAVPRPYDLAFHAACVDAVLLALFDRLGDRAEVERRTATLIPALADLRAKDRVLTSYGKQVLAEACEATEATSQRLAA